MTVIESLEKRNSPSAVAVGYFDGMHRGHRTVLEQAVSFARENGLEPLLLTFDMSALRAEGKGRKDLFPESFRMEQARRLGFAGYVRLPFPQIRDMTQEEFVDRILAGALSARAVFTGEDFRYGKERRGDVRSLRALCAARGIRVTAVTDLCDADAPVSTTRIKALVETGDVAGASRLLGFPYFLEGTVTSGNRLARQLGFPTANVLPDPSLTLPARGVYLSAVETGGKRYRGITNIGVRPTVTEDTVPVSETHLIGFEGDLYGRPLRIELLERLRPEKRFDSVEALREEVLRNVAYAAGLPAAFFRLPEDRTDAAE